MRPFPYSVLLHLLAWIWLTALLRQINPAVLALTYAALPPNVFYGAVVVAGHLAVWRLAPRHPRLVLVIYFTMLYIALILLITLLRLRAVPYEITG